MVLTLGFFVDAIWKGEDYIDIIEGALVFY
jgi:hypothetical protein